MDELTILTLLTKRILQACSLDLFKRVSFLSTFDLTDS